MMADVYLTQTEADGLLQMPKVREDTRTWPYPQLGGGISVPLLSKDRRERFLLDVSRGRIDLKRVKFQNRARQEVVLVRLEIGGPTHRNPDDTEVPCPHIHLYRAGYGDKWAFPLPPAFMDAGNASQTLQEFMTYCNIVDPPEIERGLFT